MPTERELAKQLEISRNTVSTSYKELEAAGILKSYQGRGTFVVEEVISWENTDAKNRVVKFVDMALEEAMQAEMDMEIFADIIRERIEEKRVQLQKMVVVYVECNVEQSKMFSSQLMKTTNTHVIPLTLSEIKEMNSETRENLERAQVIITTFNHVSEVTELTQEFNKQVWGTAIIPDMESLVRIARYPQDTKFLFLSISNEFIYKIQGALEKAGLDDLNIVFSNSKDDSKVEIVIYLEK